MEGEGLHQVAAKRGSSAEKGEEGLRRGAAKPWAPTGLSREYRRKEGYVEGRGGRLWLICAYQRIRGQKGSKGWGELDCSPKWLNQVSGPPPVLNQRCLLPCTREGGPMLSITGNTRGVIKEGG